MVCHSQRKENVRNFQPFQPEAWSESERVFETNESRVEETRCRFFKTDLFKDSDNDERYFGFRAQDIVLQEAVADSDFDAK